MPYAISIAIAVIIFSLTSKSGRESIAITFNLAIIGGIIMLVAWTIDPGAVLSIIDEKNITAAIYTVTAIIGSATIKGFFGQSPAPKEKISIDDDSPENGIYFKPREPIDPAAWNKSNKSVKFKFPRLGNLLKSSPAKDKTTTKGIDTPEYRSETKEIISSNNRIGTDNKDINLEAYLDSMLSRLDAAQKTKNDAEKNNEFQDAKSHNRSQKDSCDKINFHGDTDSGYISIKTEKEKTSALRLVIKYLRDNIEPLQTMGKYLVWGLLAIILFMVISMIIGSLR